jgi:hypothetical protein
LGSPGPGVGPASFTGSGFGPGPFGSMGGESGERQATAKTNSEVVTNEIFTS